jgi:hypothetical protein
MQFPKFFRHPRTEEGFSLLETSLAITIFLSVMVMTTNVTVSTVNAASTVMLRSAVSTQANIVNAYVGGIRPETEFYAVSNCPDEENILVPGLTLIPPSDMACVRVRGVIAHEELPDFNSPTYNAAMDKIKFVPTAWTVEITDPTVGKGTRVTFTSDTSSVEYEEGINLL